MMREVCRTHRAALSARGCVHTLGERSSVEALATRTRDLRECGGVVRKSDYFAHRRCVAVRRERGHPCWEVAVPHCGALPTGSGHWTHRESIARIADCGREQAFKGQGSMTGMQCHPSRDAARDSDRIPSESRHRSFFIEHAARKSSGRSSTGVQSVKCSVPENSECIAAEPIGRWLNNGQGGCRADRGINGVPTSYECLQSRLCGEWLTRGDHLVGDGGHPL